MGGKFNSIFIRLLRWEYLTDLVLAEEEAKPDCPDPASEMQVRSDPIREPYKSNAGPLKLPFGPP